jgi:hypothetical protein
MKSHTLTAFAALVAGSTGFVFPGANLMGARRLASPLAAEAEVQNLRNIAIIGTNNTTTNGNGIDSAAAL